jgi:hypothetical protein
VELEKCVQFRRRTQKVKKPTFRAASETANSKEINGGADGARTRDLERDRAKFFVPDLA